MERARKGRDEAWTAGGRKRAEEGLSEEWRGSKGEREENFKGGILRRALASIHYSQTVPQRGPDTLLLQMKHSEQV